LKDALKRWLLVGPVLLYSVIFHEMAHGYVAFLNGDPTALLAGRLTLNPIPHIDLVGSLIVPAVLILARVPFFIAWAKPVPVSGMLPPMAELQVAAAGPLTNLGLAVALALVLRAFSATAPEATPGVGAKVRLVLVYGIVMNCTLTLFNLLPLPPLDGSKVLLVLVPSLRPLLEAGGFFAQLGILMVIMLVPQVSSWLVHRPSRWLAGGLLRFADPHAAWRLS
jgi:Zn-dependent protease